MSEVYVRVPLWLRRVQLACLGGVYASLLAAGTFILTVDPHPLLWAHACFVCIGTACGLFALIRGQYKLEAASLVWLIGGLLLLSMHPKPGGLFVDLLGLALVLALGLRFVQLVSFSIEHSKIRDLRR
nr:MAG TPA: hypothetical protein [Caudoviricetes sp.]